MARITIKDLQNELKAARDENSRLVAQLQRQGNPMETYRQVSREFALLARDVRVATSVAAQWISDGVDTLRQPVLVKR